jgi:hypothetical protein
MYVDCVLASPRIAQVDPGDVPLPEVVLSQPYLVVLGRNCYGYAMVTCVEWYDYHLLISVVSHCHDKILNNFLLTVAHLEISSH